LSTAPAASRWAAHVVVPGFTQGDIDRRPLCVFGRELDAVRRISSSISIASSASAAPRIIAFVTKASSTFFLRGIM